MIFLFVHMFTWHASAVPRLGDFPKGGEPSIEQHAPFRDTLSVAAKMFITCPLNHSSFKRKAEQIIAGNGSKGLSTQFFLTVL